MSNIKVCVDCANFGRVGSYDQTCACVLNIETNLVDGTVQPRDNPFELRASNKLCGKNGKWWRSKDEKPKGRGIILNRRKK